MVFSKLLFASKNTLSRVMVLVVSMGYGITKPHLGNAFKQVVAVGLSYFFFAAAFGVTHAMGQVEGDSASKAELMVVIPLAVLEAALCWWIFLCLTNTMKILSLRANNIKLKLFSRFQWVLIMAVVLTIVFAIWSIYDHYNADDGAEPDWENAWLQDGYWNMLFFIILIAVKWLWRPTVNNQRYAYSALEGGDDDDEENDLVPNFQQDSMKMRSLSARGQPQSPRDFDEDEDEDLRWVEENIPSSTIATSDNTFPSFPMDSDEELMHTRFEMSKMD